MRASGCTQDEQSYSDCHKVQCDLRGHVGRDVAGLTPAVRWLQLIRASFPPVGEITSRVTTVCMNGRLSFCEQQRDCYEPHAMVTQRRLQATATSSTDDVNAVTYAAVSRTYLHIHLHILIYESFKFWKLLLLLFFLIILYS
ncbi:hypothetical protein PUN28_019586 [Cardiocondyla obscurior]|uniref:Uncharacterized protein n=1 Tax=Cardiocondyla obscurior TaxID=286306 RepID=A0AAW2EDJ1_9HYME